MQILRFESYLIYNFWSNNYSILRSVLSVRRNSARFSNPIAVVLLVLRRNVSMNNVCLFVCLFVCVFLVMYFPGKKNRPKHEQKSLTVKQISLREPMSVKFISYCSPFSKVANKIWVYCFGITYLDYRSGISLGLSSLSLGFGYWSFCLAGSGRSSKVDVLFVCFLSRIWFPYHVRPQNSSSALI